MKCYSNSNSIIILHTRYILCFTFIVGFTVLVGADLLLADSERLHHLPVEIAVVVGAAKVGNPPVVVVTEVSGTAGADRAEVVPPLVSAEISVQLPGLQGTRLSPLSPLQGAAAEVEVFPGSHHLPVNTRGI